MQGHKDVVRVMRVVSPFREHIVGSGDEGQRVIWVNEFGVVFDLSCMLMLCFQKYIWYTFRFVAYYCALCRPKPRDLGDGIARQNNQAVAVRTHPRFLLLFGSGFCLSMYANAQSCFCVHYI